MTPIVGDLIEAGLKVLEKVLPDPQAKAEAKLKLLELAQKGELETLAAEVQLAKGQMDINLAEANSPSLFKGGWRPFIGWVCGIACAWNWIGLSVAIFVAKLMGQAVEMEPLSLAEMMPILLGMLGLGTLRTYERVSGVVPRGK